MACNQMPDCNPLFKEKGSVRFSALYLKKKRNLLVFTSVDMIVMTSMVELESLFGHLFDELSNGENQVVSKPSDVTTADAFDKRQQQQDSTPSTSSLATTISADGNFDFQNRRDLPRNTPLDRVEVLDALVTRTASAAAKPCQGDSFEILPDQGSIYTDNGNRFIATIFKEMKRHFCPYSLSLTYTSKGEVRTLIMDEAYKSKYFVHAGADKMYYDLRDRYWWPGMKKDIAEYVMSFIAIVKVKWNSKRGPEFTWEREDQMKLKYPHLFSDVSS
ncbi:putative reverse transcriptase domain-containing protein [Tanacetum coccineum]